jgi:hypothetical protein
MHILYVEESGLPRKSVDSYKHMVIGGLIVPDLLWRDLSHGYDAIKERLSIQGTLEFDHFLPENRSLKNPMRSMPVAHRHDILSEICGLISSSASVKAVACVTRVSSAYQMPAIRIGKTWCTIPTNPSRSAFSISFRTSRDPQDDGRLASSLLARKGARDVEHLVHAHQRLLSKKAFTVEYENLVETILFQPSLASAGVQLAGLISGAVWCKYEQRDDRWYRLIEPIFRRSRAGMIEGFGIVEFPGRAACLKSVPRVTSLHSSSGLPLPVPLESGVHADEAL